MTARRTAITVASAACLAICVPAVKKSEGYWPTVKVDTVGTGRPCTGGYGETEGVKCGETHTEKYWSDRLQMRLADQYDKEIGKCIHVELPDSARAAMITTAYNAGSAAVCRSPMVAKMNAGDVRGGCEALLTKNAEGEYNGWYIRAQGRVLRGLINRRRDDKKMCLAYLISEPHADRTIRAAALKRTAEQAKTIADQAANEASVPAPASKPYVCTPNQAERGGCLPLIQPPAACGGEWVNDQTYTSHPECRKSAATAPPKPRAAIAPPKRHAAPPPAPCSWWGRWIWKVCA